MQLRYRQPSLWHSGLAKDIEDLCEPWMKEVDQLLEDAALVESVYVAQGKRHPNSRTRGRTQTPAEVLGQDDIGSKYVPTIGRHSGVEAIFVNRSAGTYPPLAFTSEFARDTPKIALLAPL